MLKIDHRHSLRLVGPAWFHIPVYRSLRIYRLERRSCFICMNMYFIIYLCLHAIALPSFKPSVDKHRHAPASWIMKDIRERSAQLYFI